LRFWFETPAGLVVAVKAHPGARRAKIGPVIAAAPSPGWPEGRVRISVAAPPEDGRANEAIIQALADWLHIKPAAIIQEAGTTARDKKFRIPGAAADGFPELLRL
jgi:uncharacterized protein YggU (UPF0235/DUF167 family)